MVNKKWHTVIAECIKFNPNCDCKVGEIFVLAKTPSKGNAYICAKALSRIYKPEYFEIKVA